MANRMIHTPSYLATADLGKYWTSYSSGGNVISSGWYAASGSGDKALAMTLDAQTGWTAGFLFKYTVPGDTNFRPVFRILDGTTIQDDIRFRCSTGLFEATRNGTVIATGTTPLSSDTEYYVEIQFVIADSGGTAILKINGTADAGINSTSLDTRNGTPTTADVVQFIVNVGSGHQVKDIYVNDNSGGVDDTFWGPIVVPTLTVSGAGNSAAWTPSAGSNYENVDDSTPDDDSTYNSTTASGNTDTFAMTNTGYSAGTVKGVEWVSDLELVSASGTARVAPVYRISSTDYVRTDITPTTSYLLAAQRERLSPATASAWTLSELDGMEVGYKRTVA